MKKNHNFILLMAMFCMPSMSFAQEPIEKEVRQESIKNALGVKFLVSPLENNKTKADYLATPYRPSIVETKDRQGEPLYRYVYDYDKEGKNLGGTGPCIVRSHLKWDSEKQEWMNDSRFKAILNENGDMTTYYFDQGDGNRWKNYYRFIATYDKNHNQLTASQEYWNGMEYESTLRWVNTYNADGRIVSQQYENKSGGKWNDGMLVTWEYNENGQETYYEQKAPIGGKIQSLIKREQSYDENGNLLVQVLGSNGVTTGRFTYKWNEEDQRISSLTENWDKEQQRFYALQYTTTIYENGKEKSQLLQKSDEKLPLEETTWRNSEKAEFFYLNDNAGFNVVTSEYDEVSQSWKQKSREIRIYNSNGDLTRLASDTLNVNTNKFETVFQQLQTYDANFNLIDYKYQIPNPKGTGADDWWINITAYTYKYDSNNNCIEVTTIKKDEKNYIKMPYNNMTNQWDAPEADSWFATIPQYLDLNDYVSPTGINFEQEKIILPQNETHNLKPIIIPDNATNKQVHWQSLNPDIVCIDVDGQMKSLKEGTAFITATTLEGLFTATIEVEVPPTNAIDERILQNSIAYCEGTIIVKGDNISNVAIYDMRGLLMAAQANQTVYAISAEGWSKGIFMIKFMQEGLQHTSKVSIY